MLLSKYSQYFSLVKKMTFPKNPVKVIKIMGVILISRISHFFRLSTLIYRPINTIITVTNDCNKSCSFCHYKDELNNGSKDLTYDHFLEIINSNKISSVGRITFFGGEPLLNASIYKMIHYTKSKGYLISLITNGLLIKKDMKKIIEAPIDLITLSYYPEDFDKIKESVAHLAKYKNINISYVFSHSRLHHLESVLKYAVENSIPMVTLEGNNQYNDPDQSDLIKEGDESFSKLKKELIKKYGKKTIIRWSALTPQNEAGRKIVCCDPWDSLFINHLNQVSGCCRYPLESYEGDFMTTKNAANIEHLKTLRQQMKRNEIPEYCKGCNYLYEKDPLYK